MSLIARGRHRQTPAELRAELAAVKRQKDAATVAAIKYATEVVELQQQLDAAGIQISGLLEDLRVEREEGSRLRAALANATSVTVSCGIRDITPGDQPTEPTDVRQLRARFAGPVPAYVPMFLAHAVEYGL